MEESVIQLRKEVPLELVVSMFQKLVCSLLSIYIDAFDDIMLGRTFAESYSRIAES